MKTITIGTNIAARRREKGVTQEELAAHLGVSKPAVSKWESGQCYPDITLLPVLAAYFDISVDELIGYQPQMSADAIKRLYLQLAGKFASSPFETVYTECQQYIKDYYSCWHLLFLMGALLLNHASLAGSPDTVSKVMQEALALFLRVEQESNDAALAKQALQMRAGCYLALQQPEKAIELLEGTVELPVSPQILLAKAYQMSGKVDKADGMIQTFIFENIVGLLGAAPDLLILAAGNANRLRLCLQAVLRTGEAFEMERVHPGLYYQIHLSAAQLFLAEGDEEQALASLEDYVNLLFSRGISIRPRGSVIFNRLEELFSSLDLGLAAPRDERVIIDSAKNCVLENPAFQQLASNERYQRLAARLEQL